MDFPSGLSAELDARAQGTASAQPGGLCGLAVHIFGFHGLARHGLSLERGGIALLEGDQRPHDGGGFRLDGADDVLRRQQDFRTDCQSRIRSLQPRPEPEKPLSAKPKELFS